LGGGFFPVGKDDDGVKREFDASRVKLTLRMLRRQEVTKY